MSSQSLFMARFGLWSQLLQSIPCSAHFLSLFLSFPRESRASQLPFTNSLRYFSQTKSSSVARILTCTRGDTLPQESHSHYQPQMDSFVQLVVILGSIRTPGTFLFMRGGNQEGLAIWTLADWACPENPGQRLQGLQRTGWSSTGWTHIDRKDGGPTEQQLTWLTPV